MNYTMDGWKNGSNLVLYILLTFLLTLILSNFVYAEPQIGDKGTLTLNETHSAFSFTNLSYTSFESADLSFAGSSDKGVTPNLPLYSEYEKASIELKEGDCTSLNFSSTSQQVSEGLNYCVRSRDGNQIVSLLVKEIKSDWTSLSLDWEIANKNIILVNETESATTSESNTSIENVEVVVKEENIFSLNYLFFIIIDILFVIGIIILITKLKNHND
jgi:hypothetical protein